MLLALNDIDIYDLMADDSIEYKDRLTHEHNLDEIYSNGFVDSPEARKLWAMRFHGDLTGWFQNKIRIIEELEW